MIKVFHIEAREAGEFEWELECKVSLYKEVTLIDKLKIVNKRASQMHIQIPVHTFSK